MSGRYRVTVMRHAVGFYLVDVDADTPEAAEEAARAAAERGEAELVHTEDVGDFEPADTAPEPIS